MNLLTRSIICSLLVLLLAPLAIGQFTLAHLFEGQSNLDRLGQAISAAGDINGDGFDDIIIGVPGEDTPFFNAGAAIVISGQDGSTLLTLPPAFSSGQLGFSVDGAGDVNGDGFDDLICGAPGYSGVLLQVGYATVFSGSDGSVIYTYTGALEFELLGTEVAGMGDVNNDGHADFMISGGLGITVYSGADGSALYTFGFSTNGYSATSGTAAGDLNGDGFDDIIVAARFDNTNGNNAGAVYVYSGADGTLLFTFLGDDDGDFFGSSVSGGIDLNRDGISDIIVGAPSAASIDPVQSFGLVRAFSGADGSVLYTVDSESVLNGQFGASVKGVQDVDGDERDDFIVSAPADNSNGSASGAAFVFSGLDARLLDSFKGTAGNTFLGEDVTGAGDFNGDGYGDIAISSRAGINGTLSGRVQVYQSGSITLLTDGQRPRKDLATFDINEARNDVGHLVATGGDLAVDNPAAKGPYRTTVASESPITFSWTGVPLTGVICLFGPRNTNIVDYPGIGQFDIGMAPIDANGVPASVFVFGNYNLAGSSFHHAHFFCGSAGSSFVTYQLTPIVVPGFLTRFQCVMNPNGVFYISNAVDVTVL